MHKVNEESDIVEEGRKKERNKEYYLIQSEAKHRSERMRTQKKDDRKDTPLVNVIHHYPLS